MIKLNTALDTKFLEQVKTVTSESGRKSMSSAINDALVAGRTAMKREITQRYNLKQKEVDNNSKLYRCSSKRLKDGKIVVASRRLTVGTSTHFSITPKNYSSQEGIKIKKRKKATATIKKKAKKSLNHAFIANPQSVKGGNTMLWIRIQNKKGKESIAPIKTVSIPQMASEKTVHEKVQEVMLDKYHSRFQHYMDRNMKKVK